MYHPGRQHENGRTRVLIALLLLWLAPSLLPREAAGVDWLNGFVDITAVQAETEGVDQNTLRQEYTAILSGKLLPYVSLRTSFRYLKFDLDRAEVIDDTREEIQPSGGLIWKHPLFVFSGSGLRRRVEGDLIPGRLVTDNAQFAFSTREERYPLVSLRYDWQHIYDKDVIDSDHDTRDRRFQAGASYAGINNDVSYTFTRRLGENIISGLETTRNDHLFRWGASSSPMESGNLHLSANYRFSHSSQTDEITTSGTVIEEIPISSGLFAVDTSPENGALEVIPALTDGDRVSPTAPPINIGSGATDRNVGADLGFARSVSTLYVRTDRASGPLLQWRVFTSSDNLSWQLVDANPTIEFNVALDRYEIEFDSIETRYVKVVNAGLNPVAEVFVTEIQAFRERGSDELERTERDHLVDGRVSYRVTERLDTSADFTYQHDTAAITVEDRDVIDYALRGRYRQSDVVSHEVWWDQSYQDFEGPGDDLSDRSASYTLRLDPLPTLTSSLSLSNRRSFIDGERELEATSALAEASGMPVRGLNLSMEVGRNRNDAFFLGRRDISWTYRASLDGSFTRSLDAIISYLYRRTTSRPEDEARNRNEYSLGFDYRMTRTILGRGTVTIVNDVRDTVSQDYLLTWNLTPKLSLGAQAFLDDVDEGVSTDRYNANLNFYVNQRTTLYLTYSIVDFTGAGGVRTDSFQQGLRASF
jgi:hypothetical protein